LHSAGLRAATHSTRAASIRCPAEIAVDRSTVLALLATVALYFGWQSYLNHQYPDRNKQPPQAAEERAEPRGEATPVAPLGVEPAAEQVAPTAPGDERIVAVERPGYSARFSSRGAVLTEWVLKGYDDVSIPGRPKVALVTSAPSLETPLLELGLGDLSALDYRVASQTNDTLEFVAEAGGVQIRKTYRFEPDGYGARLAIEVENRGQRPISPEFRVHWRALRGSGSEFNEYHLAAFAADDIETFPIAPLPSMLGIGGRPAEGTLDLSPKTGEPFELDWAGVETRYFLVALLPDKPTEARARFVATNPGTEGLLEVAFEPVSLPPGTRLAREYRLYLGPKEPERLDAFGAHLDEAIQKGWAPSLTRFFTGALTLVHEFVPNYGLAIVVLTIIIRIAMAPLMVGQMRSMRRMADLAPKLKAAQERFPDDRMKQQEAMMAVYQQAGVSPFSAFGGCLPMLLQLPVFVGFYFALQSSIQLRQQPFFGWINDLSQPESLFVVPGIDLHVRALPLLLGFAMWAQQRMTPTPGMDPAQARMMQILMPVMMTLMFYRFASGLGVYWLVSTVLGIAQQQWTNRSRPAAA
jgi:YidC/Oxa1 family membrane protein insertase